MGLSLVRCPFCDRRYNVTGIPPGTRVLCTSCRTVLTVPGNRFVAPPPFWHRFVPRSGAAQAISALFGGLVLATVALAIALKESQLPPVASTPTRDSTTLKSPPTDPDTKSAFLVGNVSENLKRVFDDFGSNPRFEIYKSANLKPFVLIGEKDPGADLAAIFAQFEDLLPKLYRTFMEEFGKPLKLERIEDPELPIVFYTKRQSYDAWWRGVYRKPPIPEVYGVFSYLERRVNLYYDIALDNIDSGRTREVLLHEAIHQLVDHYTRRRKKSDCHGAWWFQEGLGNYFEGYYLTEGELTLTPGKMTSRLPLARELLTTRASEYQPLKFLIVWDVDSIWSKWLGVSSPEERKEQVQKLQCHYAQVWAFVHFLCHESDGKYREFFLEYFQCELQGQGGWDTFSRLLNRHHPEIKELNQLEEQFKEYLKKL